jgi:hypothetical protein
MSLRKRYLLGVLIGLAQTVSGQVGIETAWLPVTEAERAQKAAKVEKSAGAEALFWRVHVWDEVMGTDWQRHRVNYVRIKVFNEEGRKKVSSIEIPYGNNISVTSIEGRTIQPNGTIVPLKKEDIHEKETVRFGGIRRKVKSFAMPAVETGSIIEYRVREVHFKQNIRYLRADAQQEFPVQKITYFVKPLSRDYIALTMHVWPFNCTQTPLNLEMNGFSSTSVENLPAFQEEPYMIGEANVRAWILFFYMESDRHDSKKYWEKRGKEVYTNLRLALKVNDEIKQAAATAVAGATTDSQKVAALIGYLRKNLRGLFDSSVSDSERAKILKSLPKDRSRTSVEVFKSGIGYADEMNTLFAAMAQTVGLEARPALVSNRDGVMFEPRMADSYFLSNIDMAVKIDGEWRVFDATTRRLPANMVSWREEGTQALISDPKAPLFVKTPLSPPADSASIRRAKFQLSADGTLEGDVTMYYIGHAAADRREDKAGETAEKQQESVKELVTGVFPGAEVTNIKLEHVEDPSEALTFQYHLKIPNYAQRTGKRLLFSPLFFQQGTTPRFTAGDRKYPIAFRYAWREDDQLQFQLPKGFQIDNGENPGNLNFGEPGTYELIMGTNAQGTFVTSRVFEFGRKGMILFDRTAYPTMKKIFDEIHRRDTTVISLKQVTP